MNLLNIVIVQIYHTAAIQKYENDYLGPSEISVDDAHGFQ